MRRAAWWKSSLAGCSRAVLNQARSVSVSPGRRAAAARHSAQALLEVHGGAVFPGRGHVLAEAVGLGRRRRLGRLHAAQQQRAGHQRRAGQQAAQVGHVGDALAAEPVLHELVGDPRRQQQQGRRRDVVEIEEQLVEEADALEPVHHRVHAHQRRDGARGAQPVAALARIGPAGQRRGADGAQQIEAR
jgi:hypothetical protein